MCGILGITQNTNHNLFSDSLNQLFHRGPDGFGIWQHPDNKIMFGHRRLAILDLTEAGKQPFHYEHLTITFNGEIYNFLEIRQELLLKGYILKSESDTEVILAAYLEWGTDCFRKFNGMWALAIWDNKQKELILSRDRFGKKPLFYSQLKEGIVFASEMKAISPFLNEVSVSKDFHWCKNNIFLYEATDKCLIEGIKRFPAGHYGKVKLGENLINFTKYWNTIDEIQPNCLSYPEQVEHFRELLFDACKIRMRSDVPIGTLLSGGLDSSAIYSVMAQIGIQQNDGQRIAKDWQHAFTASFPGSFLDETEYARSVTDYYKQPLVEIDINQANDIDKLEEYSYLFEDLYITNPIPMVEVYKNVKKNGITVSLDGHGADEYLGGYSSSTFEAFFDAYKNRSDMNMIYATYKGLSGISNSNSTSHIEFLKFITRKIGIKGINLLQNSPLLSRDQFVPIDMAPRLEKMDYFTSHLFNTFHSTIMPTLLRNYDRYSMMASVESRMPLMDHRLVTFAFSLPWSSKLRNGFTKSILRDAVNPYMPHEVNQRKTKIGFTSPIAEWIKGSWKEYMLDSVYSKDFNECELIQPEILRKKVEKIITNKSTPFAESQDTWRYFSTYLWYKTFYKRVN